MKNLNFFEKLWEHSRTLRRVGLVLVMCLMAIPQVWGYNTIHLRSDPWTGGWSYVSDGWTYGGDGQKYWDVYHSGGDAYWRIKIDYYNQDYGPSTNNYVLNVGTSGYKVNEKNTSKCFKTTANAGIIRVCSNQKSGTDEYPYVWVERPGVIFKYPWSDGSTWTETSEGDVTDNNDGTYTYKSTYRGIDYFNAKSVNGLFKVAKTTTTVTGSPATGDRCEFKWTPSGYKLTGDEETNRGVFVITKLCKIQYDGNGKTGGSVPSDQEDILYNTATTVRGNDGSLVKTNYIFTGWNANNTGTGAHYAAGSGSISPTATTTTLYAEWEDVWNLKGSWDSWANYKGMSNVSSNTFQVTLSLAASTTYDFKVVKRVDTNSGNDTYYGKASTTFTRSSLTSAKNLVTTAGSTYNMHITTDVAGDYVFTFVYDANASNMRVLVKYPCATAGQTLYKFVVNSSRTSGNVCTAASTLTELTTDYALSSLAGGTLKANANTVNKLTYCSAVAIQWGESSDNTYLKIDLDCPLQTNDIIRFTNTGSKAGANVYVRHTSNTITDNQFTLDGLSTNAEVVIPDEFAGKSTLWLVRGTDNGAQIKYVEILRPIIILDAEGGSCSKSAIYAPSGDKVILPHAFKTNKRFKGWYTTSSGGTKRANYYTVSSLETLHAQWEDIPASGDMFTLTMESSMAPASNVTIPAKDTIDLLKYATVYGGSAVVKNSNSSAGGQIASSTSKLTFNTQYIGLILNLDFPLLAGDTIITNIASQALYYSESETRRNSSNYSLANNSNGKIVVGSDAYTSVLKNSFILSVWQSSSSGGVLSSLKVKRPAHYTITHDLSHVTTSSPEVVIHKAGYTATYTADDGYELPATISVTRGVTDITANCTWSAGTVTIPAADCIGDITISVTGEESSCSAPAAPTALAAASPTAKGVTLTVEDAANTNDYEFYVSTSSTAPDEEADATHSVTDAKSLTITNLVAGTTYYAWARAKCGSNKSAWTALTGSTFTTSTVTMTPTLTNVTHTSGATSGIGGSNYTAVFTASTGYSMPNPTVTIGGNAATIVTDYTWSVEGAVGTITIPANKINGNIVITLNSAAAAPSSVAISGGLLYFAGETIELTATPTGGNGPVTYQWYKGGKADGNAIKGATNATYTKASCAFGDAGSYYCKVTCGGSQSTWGQSGNAYDVKIPRLYVKTGHYYDPEKSDFGNVDFTRATASTATASIVLGSNGDYCFNIADGCGHYYGNSGTMQYNNTGWITNVSPQDCGLTTTNAGTYIFTINYSTWSQLTTTITFPSCTDPGLAYATGSVTKTLCDASFTNELTNNNSVSVSYASSNTSVAEVASDGTITLVGAGETTITASSLEQTISAVTYCADNASYTLTVNASTAAGLAYGTATMEKNVGDANFTNTLTNTNSLTGITYTSSNTAVATVDEDGEVTIKAAGTTTITASSAQQKISSTCYAAGSATYSLTVYNVYTVTYDATGGTCSPTSTNTTTSLGKVTLPTPTHASYSFLGWYNTAGTRVGGAGDEYTPTANITLYAKWQGACAGGGGSPTTIVLTDFGKQFSTSGPRYGRAYVGNISGDVHIIESNDAENQKIGDKDSTAIRVDYGSYIKVLGPNATVADYTTDSTFSSVSRVEFRFKMYNANSGGTTTTIDVYVGNSKVASAIEVTGEKTDPFKAISPITISPAKNGAVRIVNTGSGSTNKNIYLDSIAITYGGGSSCYQVTYKGNGATSGFVNDPRQYASGGYVFVSSNAGGFAKTGGYEFNGWNTKPDGSGDDYDYDGYDNDHFTITKDTTLYAMWRIVINSNTSDLTAYEDVKHKDVRVTNGATLTITQDTTVRNMLVETGSTLKIATTAGDAGVKLTVKNLALAGGYGTVNNAIKYDMPRVFINSKSTLKKANSTVNFDISVTNQFSPIAVPFRVKVSDVKYAKKSLQDMATYLTHYAIKTYNGKTRAEGGFSNWNPVNQLVEVNEEWVDNYLEPGRGYILAAMREAGYPFAVIRFPMEVDDAWTAGGEKGVATISAVETTKNAVSVTAWTKAVGETLPKNKGWNILGVPYMSCFASSEAGHDQDNPYVMGKLNFITGEYTETSYAYVNVPTHDFSEYIQEKVSDAVLLPGWCFFIQFDKTGTLTFDVDGQRQTSSLPIYAPKYEQENMPIVETGIVLSGNDASDKTTIIVSDRYTAAEYEINADLEKLFGDNGYSLATYSLSGTTRLAYNAMSNADVANIIPIGYRAPADGEYTFSINPRYAENSAFESVNLIDYETGITTNLLLNSYSFSTERTQNDARFALNVVPRKETPTDIENGASGINDANGPRKVLINDKMYIIIDGKMYDATGKMLK